MENIRAPACPTRRPAGGCRVIVGDRPWGEQRVPPVPYGVPPEEVARSPLDTFPKAPAPGGTPGGTGGTPVLPVHLTERGLSVRPGSPRLHTPFSDSAPTGWLIPLKSGTPTNSPGNDSPQLTPLLHAASGQRP